ncbi:hypothetical protein, partial [Ideonella azotifigens]|uniref:hypothetical protein n=1 Tax=Ideonella azotifigens TaxID=513160 RepID=UPI001B88454D
MSLKALGYLFPAEVSSTSRGDLLETSMKMRCTALALAAVSALGSHAAWAGEAEAKKWIDGEFQP